MGDRAREELADTSARRRGHSPYGFLRVSAAERYAKPGLKKNLLALAGVAQVAGGCPVRERPLVPFPGGSAQEAADGRLPLTSMFRSPSPSPFLCL